jgi:hypothetical protein
MKSSLQDLSMMVYPSINNSIASSYGLSQISRISKMLPSSPAISDAGFECNLTKDSVNADILVAFTKPSRHIIINSFELLPYLSVLSPVWSRVDKLIQKWINKQSIVYENIDNIWLEFDNDNQEIPEPSVFFCPHPVGSGISRLSTDFTGYTWMIQEVLELLIDDSISRKTIRYLSQCFDLLPDKGQVFQVGVMLPRVLESKAIRLCIKDIEIPKINNYLNSIGWLDSTGEITCILEELSVFVDTIAINLSVEDGIHPKIGIECYINQQPDFTDKWQMFFDFMVKRDLCTKDKISGLLEWPGHIEERSYPGIWPNNFSQASKIIPSAFRSTIIRKLHHIKIVYQPMMELQAKAYLWFGHRWIEQN